MPMAVLNVIGLVMAVCGVFSIIMGYTRFGMALLYAAVVGRMLTMHIGGGSGTCQ